MTCTGSMDAFSEPGKPGPRSWTRHLRGGGGHVPEYHLLLRSLHDCQILNVKSFDIRYLLIISFIRMSVNQFNSDIIVHSFLNILDFSHINCSQKV